MSAVPGRIDPVRAPHGRARSSSRSNRVSRRIAFAVGAAMTLLVVVVSHGSAQTPPQDAVIDARLDAGLVTLSGPVRNTAARSRAVVLARAVPGVRSVRNELSSAPLARSG